GKIVPMPGHTAGSIAIFLGKHDVIIADLVLGGYINGVLAPLKPTMTFYAHDLEALYRNLQAVSRLPGIERYHVGHGGPLTATAIESFLRRCGAEQALAQPSHG